MLAMYPLYSNNEVKVFPTPGTIESILKYAAPMLQRTNMNNTPKIKYVFLFLTIERICR